MPSTMQAIHAELVALGQYALEHHDRELLREVEECQETYNALQHRIDRLQERVSCLQPVPEIPKITVTK